MVRFPGFLPSRFTLAESKSGPNPNPFLAGVNAPSRTGFSLSPLRLLARRYLPFPRKTDRLKPVLPRCPRATDRARSPLAFFLHALQESNGRADEIETFAQLVLQEPLVAEMQAFRLIREQDERRRRRGRLRDVINLHLARGRRGPAIEI